MHCIFKTAFHPRCHLRKIVIHSFLPSRNVLRSLMCQAILDSSDVSPFIPKLLYADTLQGVTTLTLADHLQIRIICQKLQFLEEGKLAFAFWSVGEVVLGGVFLLAMKYAHAWQMKLLFNFQDLPWAQCLKNSNATFWVIFKHCGIHLKSYSCSLKPFKAVSVRLLYSE